MESEQRIMDHTANRLKSSGHADWVVGDVVKRSLSQHWKGTLAYGKVTALEADKAFLQTQLDKMVDKIPDTSKRVTFFQKLLGRGNP